ncbi:MAG: cyclic-di-AMP receptor [Muribaculaceae bacterium]|nr:cyclic-di-AMP receptor [Muribaculaceae bacterium]
MEVRKEGNRTIIDLTEDEEFNKYIAYLDKCRKRDRAILPILYVLVGILIALRILLAFL